MAEKQTKVDTFRIDYTCDKCGNGLMEAQEMVASDNILDLTWTPKWRHSCSACKHIEVFEKKYPDLLMVPVTPVHMESRFPRSAVNDSKEKINRITLSPIDQAIFEVLRESLKDIRDIVIEASATEAHVGLPHNLTVTIRPSSEYNNITTLAQDTVRMQILHWLRKTFPNVRVKKWRDLGIVVVMHTQLPVVKTLIDVSEEPSLIE